ncbi:origin recognition complex subunit 2-like, partial [Tropilaelaps mercedesae]
WIWIDATTYEPYVLELSSESLKSSTANTLSSLEHVFASLTANAKKVFMIIAEYTLDQSPSNSSVTNFRGMAFQDCYRICREAFVVNSDLTLRTQLTEFVDHDMIRIKKGPDGVEYLNIPLAMETLEMFVKHQEQDW